MNKILTRTIFPFVVIITSAISSFAQDCKLKKMTDEVTGKPKATTGFIKLQGAILTIDATSAGFDYFFVVKNPTTACFIEASEVALVFEDERRNQEIRNAGSTNCDGIFHLNFRGASVTPAVVKKLSTKKLLSFIFTDRNERKIPISLTPDQQQLLMKLSNCMAEEAKTL